MIVCFGLNLDYLITSSISALLQISQLIHLTCRTGILTVTDADWKTVLKHDFIFGAKYPMAVVTSKTRHMKDMMSCTHDIVITANACQTPGTSAGEQSAHRYNRYNSQSLPLITHTHTFWLIKFFSPKSLVFFDSTIQASMGQNCSIT